MMINDDPIRPVEPGFEGEIRDPRRFLAQFALLPKMIVPRFEPHIRVEELSSEPPQQDPRNQSVKVAFVGDDDFRLLKRL